MEKTGKVRNTNRLLNLAPGMYESSLRPSRINLGWVFNPSCLSRAFMGSLNFGLRETLKAETVDSKTWKLLLKSCFFISFIEVVCVLP